MSDLPPPRARLTSATPGYSVVLPDEPPKSRVLVALFVVGSLATAVLVGGLVLLTRQSSRVAPFIDSVAVSTSSSTTSTVLLIVGDVEFLATRSPVSHGDHQLDLSELSEGQCFDLAPGSVVKQVDCGLGHFFQLYAVGEVPPSVTEYRKMHQFYLGFCSREFGKFVGVAGVYSPFAASGTYPANWEFPEERSVSCYIYVPGEFGWTGTAKGSGDLKT